MLRRTRRVLSYCSVALIGGSSLAVLYHHDWDIMSTGVWRFGRAALTAASIVQDYKRSLVGLDTSSVEYQQLRSQIHTRSAEKLRDLCCINGGCFVKVGQHVGSLDYLLPREYVETLKVLHSQAPQSPVGDMYRVIKEDLGQEVSEIFSSFDAVPLGAASLAQVHRATLRDGHTVAVKVQHPKVRAHSVVDIATMEILIRMVAWIFPEFQLMWLAEETKKNLPLELDFYHEGQNCERVARMFSHFDFLKVPHINWELTTPRVLTMEFCEGGFINDQQYMKEHNIDVNEVSTKLGELYSEMIFVHGYIHCDPHPGNVLVNKTKRGLQLVLLDHGLYQTLTDDFRLNYCKLWLSILQTDLKALKKYSQRLGTGHLYPLFACMLTGRSWTSVSKGIDKQQLTSQEDDQIRTEASKYVPEITDILNRVPRQMLLIFKTNDLLRGIESTLETRTNVASFIMMSRCCVRAVYKHKRRHCVTWTCRIHWTLREKWTLFKITLYELYLWLKTIRPQSGKQHMTVNTLHSLLKTES